MTSKQIEAAGVEGETCGDCQVINTAPYGVRLCSKHGAVDELIAAIRAKAEWSAVQAVGDKSQWESFLWPEAIAALAAAKGTKQQ